MINIDADGFLVDWRGYVEEHHLDGMTYRELNQMDDAERHQLLREMYSRDPQLFYNLEPLPGAAEFMQFIMTLGEPYRILTSAGTDHPDFSVAEESKRLNLKKHFGIPRENIVVCPSSASKAAYVEMPDDILVDDYHRNINQWCEAGGLGILFTPETGMESVKSVLCSLLHHDVPAEPALEEEASF